jgi:hypothetical protein
MRDKKPVESAADPLTRESVWQAELLAVRLESESKAEDRTATEDSKLPGGSQPFGSGRPILEARLPSQPYPTHKGGRPLGWNYFLLCGFDLVLASGLNRWRGLT